jgi:hypothetical protein
MSSVTSVLWNTLCEHLFPSTTYHYNSGGDPRHIPDLSYANAMQLETSAVIGKTGRNFLRNLAASLEETLNK